MAQDSREDRIRAALGVSGGSLPRAERRWLRAYYEHLAATLSIPFSAQYIGEGRGSQTLTVNVVGLLDPEEAAGADGLVCTADDGSRERELPLVDVEVEADHPNYQSLDDYWYWFWNWRFDPRI